MGLWLFLLLFPVPCSLSPSFGQQPQAQSGQPIYSVNAKYVQGVGPGYWPTAGSGLTLNLAAGTVTCDSTNVSYAGGTLTLAASATNYVYLDQSNACAPASNTTGFTDVTLPVAAVTTNTTSIVAVTDLRTWFNGGKNVMYNAARFPGADAGAKIMAAHNAMLSTGGTIDARGLTTNLTTTTSLVFTKPVHLIFGHGTYTYNGTGDLLDVSSTAGGQVWIEGQGVTATVLMNNSTTGHCINSQMPYGNGIKINNLRCDSTVTRANRLAGNGINIDAGDAATSVTFEINNVWAVNHIFGIRVAQGIKGTIFGGSVNGWADGYRIEGGTSGTIDSTYANGASRDGTVVTSKYHAVPYWKASTFYASGSFVVSFSGTGGTHVFKSGGGTSGTTEPTWSTGSGSTTTDNTITWTEQGTLPSVTAGQSGMIPVWKPATSYALNQIAAPYFGTTLTDQHIYKVTTAGTSGSASGANFTGEPFLSPALASCSRSANVVTFTTSAAYNTSVIYPGALVLIANTTGGATSFNGNNTVITAPTNTTFTVNQFGPNESCTASTGTANFFAWANTSGATASDNTVVWTEIGVMPAAAFGPVYSTLRNTASDNVGRFSYELWGLSGVSLVSPGAENYSSGFHVANSVNVTILNPFCNPPSRTGALLLPGDGLLIQASRDISIHGNCGGTSGGGSFGLTNEILPSGGFPSGVRAYGGFDNISSNGPLNDALGTVDTFQVGNIGPGSSIVSNYPELRVGSIGGTGGTGVLAPKPLTIFGGISADGGASSGVKQLNAAVGCTTAASVGATCTSGTQSFVTAFPDTSYGAFCTLNTPTGVPAISTVSKSAGSFTITIFAVTAVAATANYDCLFVHR